MRYLQWATLDLANGVGGVEVHARSLHRELERLGHHAHLSMDPADLSSDWDIIHTHGSAVPYSPLHTREAIRVHTYHGSTWGRMRACGEWTWPGGYGAYFREWLAFLQADVVLAVRPGLEFEQMSRILGKTLSICGNGWDSAHDLAGEGALPPGLPAIDRPWVYIGRTRDPVKGADDLVSLIRALDPLPFVVVPGDELPSLPNLTSSGPLTSSQIRTLLARAGGLVLTSRYEGMPLVILEALASGIPVVTFDVGGIRGLSPDLEGLVRVPPCNVPALIEAVRSARRGRDSGRASRNQARIPRWSEVARDVLRAAAKR